MDHYDIFHREKEFDDEMSNISNLSNTIFYKGGSTSKDEEVFLIKKLLLQAVLAKLSKEIVQPDKYTLDSALNYLSETLCDTQKLWLNKDEYEQLIMDGNLTKIFRFIDLNGYMVKMELVDTSEEMVDLTELENNYRFYITKDMIKSFSLVQDSVVSINVRH